MSATPSSVGNRSALSEAGQAWASAAAASDSAPSFAAAAAATAITASQMTPASALCQQFAQLQIVSPASRLEQRAVEAAEAAEVSSLLIKSMGYTVSQLGDIIRVLRRAKPLSHCAGVGPLYRVAHHHATALHAQRRRSLPSGR